MHQGNNSEIFKNDKNVQHYMHMPQITGKNQRAILDKLRIIWKIRHLNILYKNLKELNKNKIDFIYVAGVDIHHEVGKLKLVKE